MHSRVIFAARTAVQRCLRLVRTDGPHRWSVQFTRMWRALLLRWRAVAYGGATSQWASVSSEHRHKGTFGVVGRPAVRLILVPHWTAIRPGALEPRRMVALQVARPVAVSFDSPRRRARAEWSARLNGPRGSKPACAQRRRFADGARSNAASCSGVHAQAGRCSNNSRSHPPVVAAASYVDCKNDMSVSSGRWEPLTTAYGRTNSPSGAYQLASGGCTGVSLKPAPAGTT
jgi:hypothetical protein